MVRPAVCDMMRRRVTFCVCVNSLSGSFQLLSWSFTFWSKESFPASTMERAAAAVTALLIEPAWKSVLGLTGVLESAPITP